MNKKTKSFLFGFAVGLTFLLSVTAAFSHPPDVKCSKLSSLATNIAKARDVGYRQDELLNYITKNTVLDERQTDFIVWLVVSIYEEGRDLSPYEIGAVVYYECEDTK